jgi:hypothetical protein
MNVNAIIDYVITEHAALQMDRRDIPLGQVCEILGPPEQRFAVRQDR